VTEGKTEETRNAHNKGNSIVSKLRVDYTERSKQLIKTTWWECRLLNPADLALWGMVTAQRVEWE